MLSQELLIIVYLTMLGFTFPVKQGYNPKMDRMKPWARELILRVIKGHGPPTGFEYQYLTPIENSTAKYLQQRYPDACFFALEPRHQKFDVF